MKLKHFIALFIVVMLFVSSGCGSSPSNNFASNPDTSDEQTDDTDTTISDYLTSADIDITQTITETSDSTNALLVSGDTE